MTLLCLPIEKRGGAPLRPSWSMRPISDPGANSFCREQQLSQRKDNSEGEGLLKLPQLRKSKSEASGSFFLMISTSCLDKPSQKHARFIHSSNRPGGDPFTNNRECVSHLTEVIHFGNDFISSVASLRSLEALPWNGWCLSVGMTGGLHRNTPIPEQ
jgi:hypothetical protein